VHAFNRKKKETVVSRESEEAQHEYYYRLAFHGGVKGYPLLICFTRHVATSAIHGRIDLGGPSCSASNDSHPLFFNLPLHI
jgi:hypothetical protein